jgi:predicted small secreted protein
VFALHSKWKEQKMKRKSALVPILMLASAALSAACGSTSASKGRPTEPTVDQPGRTISRYRDPLVEVLVDYKFANLSVGDDWMILNVAVTSSESKAIEVRREHVLVRTPNGRKIPLPSYPDFIDAYPEIQSAARRAALASDPIDFTQAGRRTCHLGFQPLPGTIAARESGFVNTHKICQGLLHFPVEGGMQPGKWELIIDFEEFDARVPFESERPR